MQLFIIILILMTLQKVPDNIKIIIIIFLKLFQDSGPKGFFIIINFDLNVLKN